MAEVQKSTLAGEMTQVFVEFVMMHAQNAALFLGQIPDPRAGQVEVNLPLAKMFIDQLTVIRQKTAGNLSADEKKVIDSAVSQLQIAYVEVAQMMKAQNINAEVPAPLFGDEEFGDEPELSAPAAAEPAPVAPVAPVAESAPAATPAAPAAPRAEEPPEEGRKRFTKSYGS